MKRYRLYLDETGTDDLTHTHDERYRYLSLTGLIFDPVYVDQIVTPKLNEIKSSYFPRDPDDSPIIFHRTHMLNAKGVFQVLGNEKIATEFFDALYSLIKEAEFKVITVVLDKDAMLRQTHWKSKNPYHYGTEVLIEKYVQWLQRRGSLIGDICAEQRRGKKDELLDEAVSEIYKEGTRYTTAAMIQNRLCAQKVKFRSKRDNITALQISDILSKPSFDHVISRRKPDYTVSPFSGRYIQLLVDQKYDRSVSGKIEGYGTKYLP